MKTNMLLGLIIIICFGYGAYSMGYNQAFSDIEPESDYFWIDNNRFHKDSTVHCSPIYDETLTVVGSWIRVTHEENSILMECLDTEETGDWKEFRDSFIMAFKEGTE